MQGTTQKSATVIGANSPKSSNVREPFSSDRGFHDERSSRQGSQCGSHASYRPNASRTAQAFWPLQIFVTKGKGGGKMNRTKTRFRWSYDQLTYSATRSDEDIEKAVNWCLQWHRERMLQLAHSSRHWAQSKLQNFQEKSTKEHKHVAQIYETSKRKNTVIKSTVTIALLATIIGTGHSQTTQGIQAELVSYTNTLEKQIAAQSVLIAALQRQLSTSNAANTTEAAAGYCREQS
jgi:hypothetical protein